MCSLEVPVLWIRVDPEYQWLRRLNMEQADTIWQCMLRYERDATAQLEVNMSGIYVTSRFVCEI